MADLEYYDDISEPILPMGARYLQVPTVITNWLKFYFTQTEHRWLPGASHLRYYGEDAIDDSSQLENAIEINRSEEYRADRSTTHRFLLVKRNAIALQKSAISDDIRQPSKTHESVVAARYAGSCTVFAGSSFPGEADFIAAEAEQLFTHYKSSLRKRLYLMRFVVSQIGDPGRISQFPGFFVVPVVLDYIYEDNVIVHSGPYPVRSINLDIK